MNFRILLKEIRKEKGLTLQQLSKMTGISTTHLNDIENNLKEPGFFIVIRVAMALKTPIEKLYKIVD